QIFQSVSFEDVAPYPLSPDGGGTALQIVSIGENMNKPSNWMESCPAGTPGSLLVMPCITGIEEQEIDVIMKLQPNPATSVLHITFTRPLNACQLSVYDITGKLMLKHNIQQSNLLLDVANYNSGMYVIEVVAENEHFTNTFIKQ
ncbi:MAG TPA: T9SS type A sorting domain-containing protein, partial [Chitinophagales bacterium]|nr:T9SS type A sorting domain-containing protein [Chitinophagales bacterium]HRG86901.1 T9SS type A sorting domain-containing protein [Chitinophagales bacterium]